MLVAGSILELVATAWRDSCRPRVSVSKAARRLHDCQSPVASSTCIPLDLIEENGVLTSEVPSKCLPLDLDSCVICVRSLCRRTWRLQRFSLYQASGCCWT
jgi:hypothetical protein